MAAKYNVSGFVYTDEATAKVAAKEEKAVAYLRPQIKWNNSKALLGAYNQLLDQKLFHTQVGLSFLGELREALLNAPDIDNSLVRPIDTDTLLGVATSKITPDNTTPIRKRPAKMEKTDFTPKDLEEASDKAQTETLIKARTKNQKLITKDVAIEESDSRQIRRLTSENKKYKLLSQIFGLLTLLLTIAVIGMFYINSTINSPSILNYEEELLNKYSAWEQSLTERERALILQIEQQ